MNQPIGRWPVPTGLQSRRPPAPALPRPVSRQCRRGGAGPSHILQVSTAGAEIISASFDIAGAVRVPDAIVLPLDQPAWVDLRRLSRRPPLQTAYDRVGGNALPIERPRFAQAITRVTSGNRLSRHVAIADRDIFRSKSLDRRCSRASPALVRWDTQSEQQRHEASTR